MGKKKRQSSISKPTLQQIKEMQFAGNHAMDSTKFDRIDLFIRDTNESVVDRLAALKVLQEDGMGLDPTEYNEAELAAYLGEEY
jgi:hypothetical protein